MKLYKVLIPIIMVVFVGWVFYFFIYPTLKTEKVVVIPETTGLSLDEAIARLNEHNVKYKIVYQEGNDDLVIGSSPKAGTIVKESFYVDLVVSQKEELLVVDLCGLSLEEASQFIKEYENRGINIVINYEESLNYMNNLIIKQSETGKVADIDTLYLTVSKLNSLVKIPNFYLTHFKDVYAFTKENGISIKPIFIDSILPFGIVLSQDIKEGREIYKNSLTILTIYVAN